MTERTEENLKIDRECATHLVNLIINQDHVAQNFLKFMLSAEIALVVAFSFFIRPVMQPDGTVVSMSLASTAMWLIPAMGVIVAILLTLIVLYEKRWQFWYVLKFNELPQRCERIFPLNPVKSPASKMLLDIVDKAIRVLGLVIIIGWLITLYFSFH